MPLKEESKEQGKRLKRDLLTEVDPPSGSVPELLEAIEREEGRIDVNVILVQLVQKAEDPDVFIQNTEKVLAVAESFERQRVENFKRLAEAVIEAKGNDPDEVDKRRNNRTRRVLKLTVASVLVGSIAGAVFSAAAGGGIVLTGLFVIISALALAMAGPLASGESMSSTDVVRIVSALQGAFSRQRQGRRRQDPDETGESPEVGDAGREDNKP